MAYTYIKTVTLTPSSAQNSFSASNWSATNNALGNWVTVTQDPNDVTKWNITLSDNSSTTQRTTTLTATHPDSGSIQDSFNITQAGTTTGASLGPLPVINNFTAVSVGVDEIETLWDSVTGATGNLTITWGTDGSYTGTGSGTSTSFGDGSFNLEDLSADTTYYIRMTATNAEGSTTADATTTTDDIYVDVEDGTDTVR